MTRAMAAVSLALCLACSAPEQAQSPTGGRAVLEAYVDAWNRHDSSALDTLLAPDGVHEDIAAGFRRGPAEAKDFLRRLTELEPGFKWSLTNVIEDGSRVAAEWTWTATRSGEGPVGRGALVAEVANGRIKRLTDYYDNANFFRPAASDSAVR